MVREPFRAVSLLDWNCYFFSLSILRLLGNVRISWMLCIVANPLQLHPDSSPSLFER